MQPLNALRTTATAALIVLGTAAGYSSTAQAGTATAYADIDWAGLSISYLDDPQFAAPGFIDLSEGTLAGASNGLVADVNSNNNNSDWVGSFSEAVTPANLNYVGNAFASLPEADFVGEPGHAAAGDVFSKKAGWTVGASSTAIRAANFVAERAGFVVITVPYEIFASAGDGGSPLAHETASASATVALSLVNVSNGSSSSQNSTSTATVESVFELENGLFGGDFTQDGRFLAVIAYFELGETGHFQISASTELGTSSPAAIPLPAAAWLLSGALGMLAVRRRRG